MLGPDLKPMVAVMNRLVDVMEVYARLWERTLDLSEAGIDLADRKL